MVDVEVSSQEKNRPKRLKCKEKIGQMEKNLDFLGREFDIAVVKEETIRRRLWKIILAIKTNRKYRFYNHMTQYFSSINNLTNYVVSNFFIS